MAFLSKVISLLPGRRKPFHEFGYLYRSHEKEILQELQEIIRMDQLGEHLRVVRNFEKLFAGHLKTGHALGAASGTSALYQGLKAVGVGPGDEVVTVANTFISTITAIRETGAQCRFVDVQRDTGMMDPDLLKKAIGPQTAAVVPVHMYGSMAQMDRIMNLARAKNVFVVEDACQSVGSKCGETFAGAWGDIGCFSFHTTKLVGAPGDGGMTVTSSEMLQARLKKNALASWEDALQEVQFRVPSRLSPLLVPFLRAKLRRLGENVALREQQFRRYREGLGNLSGATLLDAPAGVTPSRRNCILVSGNRDAVLQALHAKRIPGEMIYPGSKSFLDMLEGRDIFLPHTRHIVENHVALPIGPHISEDTIDKIVALITRLHGVTT